MPHSSTNIKPKQKDFIIKGDLPAYDAGKQLIKDFNASNIIQENSGEQHLNNFVTSGIQNNIKADVTSEKQYDQNQNSIMMQNS